MAYFPDLSPFSYLRRALDTLNVGWLDGAHEYAQGAVPQSFVEKLLLFRDNPTLVTLGTHDCELCQNRFGSGEVWVFADDGSIYIAPDLIYHYVVDHQYCPPEQFIQAVLACPLPDSPEYQKLVAQAN